MAANPFALNGRNALITGAGRGLGRACAIALAQAGAHVTLVSRTEAELHALVDELTGDGLRADALVCDCSDTGQIRQQLGDDPRVWDILVNNAGTNQPQEFVEVEEAVFDRIMQVNLKGAFFVAQTIAQKLIAAGRAGSIINMSSQMGLVGGFRRTVYCASKHAIEGLTKAMAIDLAGQKIRVNTVCPTFVLTPMTKPFLEDPAFAEDVLRRIPLGVYAEVEDVAHAVLYLASDGARMVTGSALTVDGGWTAI